MRLAGNPGSKCFARCGCFDLVVSASRNVFGQQVMHERMRNGAEGRKRAHERKIGLRRTGPTCSIRALRVALAVRYILPV